MSHYALIQCDFTSEPDLIAALQEVSPQLRGRVEHYAYGTPLIDYHGKIRPERAHIVIRRQHLNAASNDLGFARGANGVYTAIISDYDQSLGYNAAWLARVKQVYARNVVVSEATRKGQRILGQSVKPDGSIVLRIQVG